MSEQQTQGRLARAQRGGVSRLDVLREAADRVDAMCGAKDAATVYGQKRETAHGRHTIVESQGSFYVVRRGYQGQNTKKWLEEAGYKPYPSREAAMKASEERSGGRSDTEDDPVGPKRKFKEYPRRTPSRSTTPHNPYNRESVEQALGRAGVKPKNRALYHALLKGRGDAEGGGVKAGKWALLRGREVYVLEVKGKEAKIRYTDGSERWQQLADMRPSGMTAAKDGHGHHRGERRSKAARQQAERGRKDG